MSTASVSPRADFVASLAWIAFGLAIVVLAWNMDRLERFGGTLHTAPGLVPGILGALIVLLGLVLLVRSVRRGALATLASPWSLGREGRDARMRVAAAIALTLAYTLALVGRGLPFWLVTAAFVFVFLLAFDVPARRARGQAGRGLAIAAVVAVATSASVTLLFERVFLVRMP